MDLMGFFQKIGMFLLQLVRVPGRLEQLVATKKDEVHRVRYCPNCDQRMFAINTTANSGGFSFWRYQCQGCKAQFTFTFAAKQ